MILVWLESLYDQLRAPRECGDDPAPTDLFRRDFRVLPANAGMIRWLMSLRHTDTCSPRMRG
ncbi:hypothetical protein MXEN_12286 [Mycobacterium xenopi RIVM700367]|nr:hypothetical protein MXEN_12286 [Mycobacterium xenopi RIVM700367]